MKELSLNFNTDDTGLNLTGVVNFPNTANVPTEVSIGGMAEWRHVPGNIVHVNETFLGEFNLISKAKNLSKAGINFIGIKARTNILLSHTTRTGRNGTKKVQELLTKFFKALGATSIKFDATDNSSPDSDLNSDSSW